ncbi:SGNH/GDSL hydrolase family protein [Amycolatopsis thailandensis]|uniref:SGNH/GDSL hydrolase family protein n=1 Tax=Amycolatopsis thailandensis TaxID=589330 RepID=UPI00362D503E
MSKRLLGAFLAACTLTTLTASPAQAAPTGLTAGSRYVALGSSFAAGPGIPPRQAGSPEACGRSSKNYAALVARKHGLTLTDVTCSSATTANILDTKQGAQRPQIEAVTAETRLVTVTIGGNDVGYVGSLFTYSCENSGRENCGKVDQGAVRAKLDKVHERIGAVVAAVRERAPRAKIVLVDYLTIVPGVGPACDGVPLTQAQLAFEREVASRLSMATWRAAINEKALIAPAGIVSAGHHACAKNAWMEKYTTAPGRVSYHPNEAGMSAVASLVGYLLR